MLQMLYALQLVVVNVQATGRLLVDDAVWPALVATMFYFQHPTARATGIVGVTAANRAVTAGGEQLTNSEGITADIKCTTHTHGSKIMELRHQYTLRSTTSYTTRRPCSALYASDSEVRKHLSAQYLGLKYV
jgi:hypothetical protein